MESDSHRTDFQGLELISGQKDRDDTTPGFEKANNVLIVGFTSGFTALRHLISNKNATVECLELGTVPYARRCFTFLKHRFRDRVSMVSETEVSALAKMSEDGRSFDCFHISDITDFSSANATFHVCNQLAAPNAKLTWSVTGMQELFDNYVRDGLITNPTGGNSGVLNSQAVMNISVCSLTVGEQYSYVTRYGKRSKEMYCAKHGYEFFDEHDHLDGSRPVSWSKIPLILAHLSDCDYLVWIDGDTYIMDDTVRLEGIISKHAGDADITVTRDWMLPNLGVILIKNTEWSRKFLELVYDQTQHIDSPNWEQSAFLFLHEHNVSDCQSHINILPLEKQSVMNSYWYMYKYKACFILHFAGCFNNISGYLTELMQKYCPIKRDEETQADYDRRLHWLEFESEADQVARVRGSG